MALLRSIGGIPHRISADYSRLKESMYTLFSLSLSTGFHSKFLLSSVTFSVHRHRLRCPKPRTGHKTLLVHGEDDSSHDSHGLCSFHSPPSWVAVDIRKVFSRLQIFTSIIIFEETMKDLRQTHTNTAIFHLCKEATLVLRSWLLAIMSSTTSAYILAAY